MILEQYLFLEVPIIAKDISIYNSHILPLLNGGRWTTAAPFTWDTACKDAFDINLWTASSRKWRADSASIKTHPL